ncbi:MAG: DinB family protein [Gemmatimonadota bacterium]|nr:DinB family protein [Gemmatimonadota bacterium]
MLPRLFDHLAWADAKARDALRAMPASTAEAKRATELYAHVAAAEHVWLARLMGRPQEYPVWPELDLDAGAELAARTASELRQFVASLCPEDLAREVDYANSAGRRFRDRVEDILMHVAMHGAYHRGQIALLTRQGGGEPASTDYIAFVRGAPAATRTSPPAAGRS